MKIKFWGVRGSIPSNLPTEKWAAHFEALMFEFFQDGHRSAEEIAGFMKKKTLPQIGGFGTATTCVQVSDSEQFLIIDGGSGIKNLSDDLAAQGKLKTQNEYHILLSHFHFDHTLGLPFFTPHFLKGKKIHYYSVQTETEKIVRNLFTKPSFPITFENLQADIQFHTIRPYEKKLIQGFEVTAFKLDHPDPCYGFRVEKNNRIYAHAIDHESVRMTAQELGLDSQLFQDAHLLYFDAQYEESDMNNKKGWGHGTCDRGFQVVSHFNVQQILFAHHDPSADLQALYKHKKNAEITQKLNYAKLNLNPKFKWDFAYEGQEIEI